MFNPQTQLENIYDISAIVDTHRRIAFGLMRCALLDSVKMCSNPDDECAEDKDFRIERGMMVSCQSCNAYVEAKDGKVMKKMCPDIEGWGFNRNIGKCEYRSSQCFECNGRLHIIPCLL